MPVAMLRCRLFCAHSGSCAGVALRRIAPRAAALHKASTIAAVVGTSLWSRGVRVFIGYYLSVRTKIDNNGNHWLT